MVEPAPHPAGVPRTLLALVALALVVASFAALVRDQRGPGTPPPRDFAQYWVAGKLALEGRVDALYFADLHAGLTQPEFPNSEFGRVGRAAGLAEASYFLCPPWFAVACAPLALLPPWPAYALARFLSWLAVLAAFLLLPRTVPAHGAAATLATAALLAFAPPVRAALLTAQASAPLLLLLVLFARALARGREAEAGAWWGLAVALKLFPLVLAAWLVARGRWRALAAGLATGLALALAGVAAGGPATTARFAAQIAQHAGWSTTYASNQSLTALALRATGHANPFDWVLVPVPASLAWGVRLALLALLSATLAVALPAARRAPAWGGALGLGAAVAWALLVAPDAWLHYLAALALPFTAAAARMAAELDAGRRRRAMAAWTLGAALLFGYDLYERVSGPGATTPLRAALAGTPALAVLALWGLLVAQLRALARPSLAA